MLHIKRREDFFVQKVREGILSVDDNGHVYRIYDEFRGKPMHKRIDHPDKTGYRRVAYRKDRVNYECKVHRLVFALHHPIPDGYVINHKDGNKENNRLSNLEAVTQKENTWHAIYVTKTRPRFGARLSGYALTPLDIQRILELRGKGYSFRKIAKCFRITKERASRIVKEAQEKMRKEETPQPQNLIAPGR